MKSGGFFKHLTSDLDEINLVNLGEWSTNEGLLGLGGGMHSTGCQLGVGLLCMR